MPNPQCKTDKKALRLVTGTGLRQLIGKLHRAPAAAGRAGGLVLLLCGSFTAALAQVSNPNEITGIISWNNNPSGPVHAYLNSPLHGLGGGDLSAAQVGGGFSASTIVADDPSHLSAPYSITVQAGDPGGNPPVPAIPYNVSPQMLTADGYTYVFETALSGGVVFPPATPDVLLDFTECAGLVEVQFCDLAGDPVVAGSGNLFAHMQPSGFQQAGGQFANASSVRLAVRSGTSFNLIVNVIIKAGTDEFVDYFSITYTTNYTFTVGCDQIVTNKFIVPPSPIGSGGGGDLGEISGLVDIVGRHEHWIDRGWTLVTAAEGPFANYRYDTVEPACFPNCVSPLVGTPTDNSAGTFLLPNLLPSNFLGLNQDYHVGVRMNFEVGRRYQVFSSPRLNGTLNNPGVTVAPGATMNLGTTFVMTPGWAAGAVFLCGPPEEANSQSALHNLIRPDYDVNGDGIPEDIDLTGYYGSSHVSAGGLDVLATGASRTASGGSAAANFEGAIATSGPDKGSFVGDYELALAGLDGQATRWNLGYLTLLFENGATPAIPDSYIHNRVGILNNHFANVEIIPTTTIINDHRYGFSEVTIFFHTTSGFLFDPVVGGSGAFQGINFQGNPADYDVTISAVSRYNGAGGTPVSIATAAIDGQVVMLLPEGTYTLNPSLEVTADGISSSHNTLLPFTLVVPPCTKIGARPEIQMTLTNLPSCATNRLLDVTGAVTSGTNVASISYELNGASFPICNNCGVSPSFAFSALLADCENTLTITAIDANGRDTSIQTTIHYDLTPPVLSGCTNISTTIDPGTNGAVAGYSVTALDNCDGPVPVDCVPESGSFFPSGQTLVTCTAVDRCDNTNSCEFTVTVMQCVEVLEDSAGCSGTDGFGSYRVCVRNDTGHALGYLTMVDFPAGILAAPYFIPLVPPLPDGQTRCVTVALSGLGEDTNFCFRLMAHSPDFEECCIIEHCATLDALPLAIAAEPADLSVGECFSATFSAAATGSAPLTYTWCANGVAIPGADGPFYTTPPATLGDNGTIFTVKITDACGSVTSREAVLTVIPDLGAPLLVSAAADCASNKVTITFSKAVMGSPGSGALDPFSYAINGGSVNVLSATFGLNQQIVCLFIDPSTPLIADVPYTLTANGVADLCGNVIDSQIPFLCPTNPCSPVASPCAPLFIERDSTNNVILTWTGNCQLQTTLELESPAWAALPASSPFVVPIGFDKQFFRTVAADGSCSPNVVGYVSFTLEDGKEYFLANPLNGPNNHLDTLLPLPASADGTVIDRFDPVTQNNADPIQWFFGSGWSTPNGSLIIDPGEGFFITMAGTHIVTFVGEVPQGNLVNPLPQGLSYQSSIAPVDEQVGGVPFLGLPAADGDGILLFDPVTQNFTAPYQYIATFGWLSTNPDDPGPAGPFIPAGTGFFFNNVGPAKTWNQTFTASDCPPTPPPSCLTCAADKTAESGSAWTFDSPSTEGACCGNATVNVVSTVTNGMCPQFITRTWQAIDCCDITNTCSQTVTVVDTTPPVIPSSVCTTNYTDIGTTDDNFVGTEPAIPSAGLLARLTAAGVNHSKGFDDCRLDNVFAHTLTNLPSCIVEARLCVRLRPCHNDSGNDTFGLSFTDPNGQVLFGGWGGFIGSGQAQPGLTNLSWGNMAVPNGVEFCLDLSALPLAGGGTIDLLPYLNQYGFVDFVCQDDTGVDYLTLDLKSSCCGTNKTVECGSGWTFETPVAVDVGCGTNVTYAEYSTVTNGNDCLQTIIRTWQITDCCSNSTFCTETVNVVDTTVPVLTGCTNIFVALTNGQSSATVDYVVTAMDICADPVTLICTPPAPGPFPPGTTAVTCAAVDACGNSSTCGFDITVANHCPCLAGTTPPANDTPTTASPLTAPATVNGCLTYAGPTPLGVVGAFPFLSSQASAKDVWFSFSPTVEGVVTVDTCGPADCPTDTVLAIYSGSPEALLRLAPGQASPNWYHDNMGSACSHDPRASSVRFRARACTTYYIRVSARDASLVPEGFTLNLTQIPTTTPPVNDACAWAGNIGRVSANSSTRFDNLLATTGAPLSPSIFNDLWFRFVAPPLAVDATVEICATFNATLAVYTGNNSCDNLTLVPLSPAAANCPPGSTGLRVTFPVTNGVLYRVRVGGVSDADLGCGFLRVTSGLPPVNTLPSGIPNQCKTYAISGRPSGQPWSWSLTSPWLCRFNMEGNVAGIPATGSAIDVATAFALSINAAAGQPMATALPAFPVRDELAYLRICTPCPANQVVLKVGDPGTPDCWVETQSFLGTISPCVFNPSIYEIAEPDADPDAPESDCNGNGQSDYVDIVTGSSLDVDGNNVPDECPIRLHVVHEALNSRIVIRWIATDAVLEQSSSVNGPWDEVLGAASPHVVGPPAGQTFFRLRLPGQD